ncbi:MAG: glycoside hydrolase/phage tail family protein, partial [Pseudomonadota bacterium]
QVAAFTGTAAAAHFGLSGETVTYAGPEEWSYRRMILHYAHLAKAAGGVDAFLIGSEMRGLTHVRDGATSYPFVRDLIALATDVRAVLGPDTKITYAADWSEYFGHQPNDGSGDAIFHLDPLWSSADIDAIGIDCYWPLSDWRDGDDHLDRTRAHSDSDLGYLKSNIAGGEGFDWYYASAEDRAEQVRTPITDGAGKPWVYRFKDLKSWWENPHFDRVGGSEVPEPTAWQPQSKPVWFMELGCPAIDKGANQPNVFWDEKSSESAWPYFSTGQANELIQRRYAQAFVEGYGNDAETSLAGLNPTSAVYGGPMVDLDRLHLYVWDARPYPAFPYDLDTWSDGGNWQTGHWLNGRAGANDLADVVRELFAAYGMTDVDVSGLAGLVPGFVLDRPMPLREAFQTLELAYFLDVVDSGGTLRITHRQDGPALLTVGDDDVVEEKVGASLISLTRGQESDLPQTVRINYVARDGRYAAEVADARRTTRSSRREATATLAVMLDDAQASSIAESWLYESWAMRERLNLSLPPSKLAVEPGDRLGVRIGKRTVTARIDEIADHGARVIEARAIDTAVYNAGPSPSRATQVTDAPVVGIATVAFLDLPLLDGTEPESAGYVAAAQSPWPGGINVYRSSSDTGYALATQIAAPSIMGTLAAPLAPSPSDRWTHPAGFDIRLISGELASRTDQDVFDGRNVAAIQHENGAWEVIQFAEAELIGPKHYRIRRVLRGQAGTDGEAVTEIPAGATFVLIDGRESQLEITPGDLNRELNWRYGP